MKLTAEEYEFIKFYNSASRNRRPDGILVLRHYGLRAGKRIIHSLIKKGVLEWNEEDSADGIYSPIKRGKNYLPAVISYQKELLEKERLLFK